MNPIKNYIKSQTTWAFRSALRQVEKEWQLSLRHRRSLKKVGRFVQTAALKLNLGCGENAKQGWVNVDLFHPDADLQLDLREPWPFAEGRVSHVYSEHVFEHFEFHSEVSHFLSESLRVLQPGAIFDVGVPDADWALRSYGNQDSDYWHYARTVFHPKWCETQLDHLNFHFRQNGQHKYAWNEETLSRSLSRSGFVGITRRQFDPSLDGESRRIGTLYMRAAKPV